MAARSSPPLLRLRLLPAAPALRRPGRSLSSSPFRLRPPPGPPIYRRFPRAGEQPKIGLSPTQQRILDIERVPDSPRSSSSGGRPTNDSNGGGARAFWATLDGRKRLLVVGLVGASGYYVYQCVPPLPCFQKGERIRTYPAPLG
jgi:hypothetical protein